MIRDRSKSILLRRPLALATTLSLLAPSVALAQEAAPTPVQVFPSAADQALSIDPEQVVPQADAPVITLEEMVARASRPEGSLDIAVLRERLEQASISTQRAWAALLPVVQAMGSYTRNSVSAIIPFPDFTAGMSEQPGPDGTTIFVPNRFQNIEVQPADVWNARITASMPILLMPAYYGIASANQAEELTRKSVTFARNEVIFALTQAYYGAVASKRIIEVSAAQLASAREQERVSQARFEVGEIPKVGYLRASVQRAQFEQDLVRAQNAYVSAKLAIAALVGLEGANFTVVEPPVPEVPEGSIDELVNAALRDRKDLAAQRDAEEIARRAVKAAYWQFAPIITANGYYNWANYGGFTGEPGTWAVTINAVFTIFDWSRYADIDEAKSQLRQSRAQRENLARTVIQEVKTSILELESARANLIRAEEQARLATENAGLVRAQYEAGAATYLDLVDAQATEFSAQVAVVTERLNTQVASLRLSRNIGKFGAERFD